MGLQVMVEWFLSVTAVQAVVGRQHVKVSGQCPLKGNQDKILCSHEDKNLC